MKKWLLLIIVFAAIAIGFYFILYNGFSDIERITIQTYDEPFEQGKSTTDSGKIKEITSILNRADHITGVEYKLAGRPTYKIRLQYKNETSSETLDILEHFDRNETLLISSKGDYYKITTKQTERVKELLLN